MRVHEWEFDIWSITQYQAIEIKTQYISITNYVNMKLIRFAKSANFGIDICSFQDAT